MRLLYNEFSDTQRQTMRSETGQQTKLVQSKKPAESSPLKSAQSYSDPEGDQDPNTSGGRKAGEDEYEE